MQDAARGGDAAGFRVCVEPPQDRMRLRGHVRIDKFDEAGRLYETVEDENLFLTVGCTEILKLVTGASANIFDNTHAQIGIGDSSTAASAGQTDLQAASNKTYKAMDATFPTTPASGSVSFRATFGTTDANYAWNEFVVKHSTSAICLDRGVGTFGTKASGTSWQVTVTLSIA